MLDEIRRSFQNDENGLGYSYNLAEQMFAAVNEADPEKWDQDIVDLIHLGDELPDRLRAVGVFVPRDVDPWDVLITMKTMMKLRQIRYHSEPRFPMPKVLVKYCPVGKVFEGVVTYKGDSEYWVSVPYIDEDVIDSFRVRVPFTKLLGSNDDGKGKRVRLKIESLDIERNIVNGQVVEVLSQTTNGESDTSSSSQS